MTSAELASLLKHTDPELRDYVRRFVEFDGLHWFELYQCAGCGVVGERNHRGSSKWCHPCSRAKRVEDTRRSEWA